MSVTSISRDFASDVSIVRMTASNTIVECTTADYLTAQADTIASLNNGTWEWLETDLIAVSASDGHVICEFNGSDFATLVPLPAGSGTVTLPVTDGDFVVFDGTLGGLKDAGYSATNAAKTKVVMANGAVTSGGLAVYKDTAGTVGEPGATSTLAGNLAVAGYNIHSNANALTAHVGGGQGSALQLAKEVNRVTTVASAGDSVKLPASVAGMQVTVINAAAANAMDCFPSSGDAINALVADTALSIVANSTVIFTCAVAGVWNTVVTA